MQYMHVYIYMNILMKFQFTVHVDCSPISYDYKEEPAGALVQ